MAKNQNKAAFESAASQLESFVNSVPKGAKEHAVGCNIFGNISSLIAALKGGNPEDITRAVRDVFNCLLGDDSPPMMSAADGGILTSVNWKQLLTILAQVLPLLFA